MSRRSSKRRLVVPWLVAAFVCGFSAQAGFAAQEAETKAPPAVAAPAEEPPSKVVIYKLEKAKADAVVTALKEMLSGDDSERVKLVPDEDRNGILVSAPEETHRRVAKLIAQLDVPEELVTKVFHLKYARGESILSAIRPMAPEAEVAFDSRLNCLIVAGPQESVGRVQELVQTLDAPEDIHVRIFRLRYAPVDTVVTTMAELVPDVRMTVDTRSNSIIVAAPEEAFERVGELIETLDIPPDADLEQRSQISVYQLHHIEARNAVLSLQSLLGLSESSGVRVDADPKSNRLFLYAPLATQLQVKGVLERLDAPPEPGGDQQVKVFELYNSDATTLAETVSGLLDAEEVTISVDPRSNSLIAKGPEGILMMLEALLLRLDEQEEHEKRTPPSTTYHVRVVWLASGLPEGIGTEPADDLSDVLAELAKVGVTGVRQVGQAMIHTLPDGRFQITCSPMLGEAQTEMNISGELEERHGMPYLDIQVSAKQVVYVPASPDPRLGPDHPQATPKQLAHEGLIDLETEIAAPLGHYVVLGVTTVRETTSVFVVRITESDPVSRPPSKEESAGR
jgi:hypothetical protein